MHQGSIGPTKLLTRQPRQIDRLRCVSSLLSHPREPSAYIDGSLFPLVGKQREKLRSLRRTLRRIIYLSVCFTLNASARVLHGAAPAPAKPLRLPCATNDTDFEKSVKCRGDKEESQDKKSGSGRTSREPFPPCFTCT